MTSAQFSNMVTQLAQELVKELPVINEKAAMTIYSKVKNRIESEGTIGENKSLGQYSTNEVPLFFRKGGKTVAPFSSGGQNNGGDQLREKVRKENIKRRKNGEEERGISYKQWREANNRLTDHVYLSFTGTTLNDIGVVKQIIDGTKVVTIVGAKNTKTRENGKTTSQVMNYLGDQYGDFLSPNTQEVQLITSFYNKEIDKIIKKTIK